jgi:hypothetical protein
LHNINTNHMAKVKKPTNKAKFSIYVDRDLMAKYAKRAKAHDRSINYEVEKSLGKDI